MPGKRQRKSSRIAETKAPYDTRSRRASRSPRSGTPPATSSPQAPLATEDWEWVRKHHAELEQEYAGHWIAVSQQRVVGHGVRLATALKRAKASGVEHPLVLAFRPPRLRDAVYIRLWL